ncbi:hypothetical protein INR49_001723, partial [Caranx melampygus]
MHQSSEESYVIFTPYPQHFTAENVVGTNRSNQRVQATAIWRLLRKRCSLGNRGGMPEGLCGSPLEHGKLNTTNR